jgi:hypothetical protein
LYFKSALCIQAYDALPLLVSTSIYSVDSHRI